MRSVSVPSCGKEVFKGLSGAQEVGRGLILRLAATLIFQTPSPGLMASTSGRSERCRAPCRHHQLQLSDLSRGRMSCWGSWQDLPPHSAPEGSPQLLGAGSGPSSHLPPPWSDALGPMLYLRQQSPAICRHHLPTGGIGVKTQPCNPPCFLAGDPPSGTRRDSMG